MATLESILLSQAAAPTQGVNIVGSTTVGGVLLWIRYEGAVGSGASFEVDASTGDYEFTTDGTTADTTIGLPTLDGTIDVSDASANTLGELADNINSSANWSCVLLGGLRANLTANATLTVAEVVMSTQAKKNTGHYCYQDPAVVDATSEYGMAWAISGFDPSSYNKLTSGALTNPDLNCQSSLIHVIANTDWSSSGYLALYSCSQSKDGDAFKILPILADNTDTPLGNHVSPIHRSSVGERLIVRVVNDASGVSGATTLDASGFTTNTRGDIKPGYSLTNAAG